MRSYSMYQTLNILFSATFLNQSIAYVYDELACDEDLCFLEPMQYSWVLGSS